MNEHKEFVARIVLTCQIIKLALASGVVLFGGVAMVIGQGADDAPEMLMIWLMIGLAIAMVVARFYIPGVITDKAVRQLATGRWNAQFSSAHGEPKTDEEKIGFVYQTQMIIGSALLEGAAFGNLAAYMTEGAWISLATAALLLGALLVDFPTYQSVADWIERQTRRLHEERMLSGPPQQ